MHNINVLHGSSAGVLIVLNNGTHADFSIHKSQLTASIRTLGIFRMAKKTKKSCQFMRDSLYWKMHQSDGAPNLWYILFHYFLYDKYNIYIIYYYKVCVYEFLKYNLNSV